VLLKHFGTFTLPPPDYIIKSIRFDVDLLRTFYKSMFYGKAKGWCLKKLSEKALSFSFLPGAEEK